MKATKLQKARAIVALDQYRQEAVKKFQELTESQAFQDLNKSEGSGELKLIFMGVKDSLVELGIKIEDAL